MNDVGRLPALDGDYGGRNMNVNRLSLSVPVEDLCVPINGPCRAPSIVPFR